LCNANMNEPVDLKSVGGVGVQYSMTFVLLYSIPLALKFANACEGFR
jgi:hypothetical protein